MTNVAYVAFNKKIVVEIEAKLGDSGKLPKTPSAQQQAFIDWLANGEGNAFVEAVAGSGKTTSLLMGIAAMPGAMVKPGTFHSFGLAALRTVHRYVKVDDKKMLNVASELACPEQVRTFAIALVRFAKNRALGLFGSVDDDSQWWDIVDHHDVQDSLEDPEAVTVIDGREVSAAELGIMWAKRLLIASNARVAQVIDFDDMIYVPVVKGYRFRQFDMLLVDEAQDTNPARRALARAMLSPTGRAVFVGDRYQAIYGFTGADNDAVDQIITEFNAIELPLTVSYRCPKAVIAEAQKVVPHIEAAPTAIEGKVSTIDQAELLGQGLTAADAILCRLTAPIVEQAFALIRAGIACHVEGRDIGQGLMKLARRWSRVKTLPTLADKLDEYRERETKKLLAKGREVQAEALNDRVETLLALMEGCQTLAELQGKIDSLFQDTNGVKRPTLTLSTVHKSKGREWSRVFVLGAHQYMPSKWARQQWQKDQERNLIYVAYTRSQGELVMVNVTPKQSKLTAPNGNASKAA